MTALRPLFEWSLLEVDGEPLGPRWADLWTDPGQHAARSGQIDAWLARWSSWVDRIADPQGWAQLRGRGIRVQRLEGVPDRVVVTLRRPQLRDDTTGTEWRLDLTLRGDEWLISRIDHRPASPR